MVRGEVEPELTEGLRRLGERWGPLEVALAAVGLTDPGKVLAALTGLSGSAPDGLSQKVGAPLRWTRRTLLPTTAFAGDPPMWVVMGGLLDDVKDDLDREGLLGLGDATLYVHAVEVPVFDDEGRPVGRANPDGTFRPPRRETFNGPPPGWCEAVELSMEVSVEHRG